MCIYIYIYIHTGAAAAAPAEATRGRRCQGREKPGDRTLNPKP